MNAARLSKWYSLMNHKPHTLLATIMVCLRVTAKLKQTIVAERKQGSGVDSYLQLISNYLNTTLNSLLYHVR